MPYIIKNSIIEKVFTNTITIDTPVISEVEYDFDYLSVPQIDEDAAARILGFAEDVQNLQNNAAFEKLIEESMLRNQIQKELLDLMVQEATKQAKQNELKAQALFDYIMGMIFEYLVQPAGIPRDDWSNNQSYFQNITNMIMSGVQAGSTNSLAFRNNYVSNLGFYQTNQAYYNDYAAFGSVQQVATQLDNSQLNLNTQQITQIATSRLNLNTQQTTQGINTRVLNIQNLLRNTGY